MSVNLRVLLEEMIEREASDLHITAGERPKLRVDGDITNANSCADVMTPKDTLRSPTRCSPRTRRSGSRPRTSSTSPSASRTWPASAATCFKQRGCVAHGHPHDSLQRPHLRGARPAAGGGQAGRAAARPDPGDRARRARARSHHARGDDRQDQQGAEGPHHHGGGPDRVHPPPPELHRQPARGGHRHQELRDGAQVRAARGPRRDPGRRNARPRDDRRGAHHRRDRPPGPRDAAHQLGGRVDQPHHRRLPVEPAVSRCGPSWPSCSRAW